MLAMSKKTDPLDDIISITLPNNSSTYTMNDTIGMYDDITLTSTVTVDDCDITYESDSYYTSGIDLNTIGFGSLNNTITVGDTTINEQTLKKVLTIIDMFEQDEELSKILKAQMALNRLKD